MFHPMPPVNTMLRLQQLHILLNTQVYRLKEFFTRGENMAALRQFKSTINKQSANWLRRWLFAQERAPGPGAIILIAGLLQLLRRRWACKADFWMTLKRCEEANGMCLVGRPRGAAAAALTIRYFGVQPRPWVRWSQRLIALMSNFSINKLPAIFATKV
jgi:hypothetical protein